MGDIGSLAPVEPWLTGAVVDPDLAGPIAKARAEFGGKSEDEVRRAWAELETVFNQWSTDLDQPYPTYATGYRRRPDGALHYLGRGQGERKPDFVVLFQRLASGGYRPLLQFIRHMHSNATIALCKVLALLVLREAGDGNPRGALNAAGLFDRLSATLRPFIDHGLQLQQHRRKGGRTTANKKSATAKHRNAQVAQVAEQYRATSLYSRGQIVESLAQRFNLSPRTVRRILKEASF